MVYWYKIGNATSYHSLKLTFRSIFETIIGFADRNSEPGELPRVSVSNQPEIEPGQVQENLNQLDQAGKREDVLARLRYFFI